MVLITAGFFFFVTYACRQRLQHHPNIAHLVGVCTNRYPFCLVSEYYPRGSLYDILVKRKEDVEWHRLVWVAMTAAAGILHLHKEDVVHRDISARNILVQVVDGRWIAKVADFGLSRVRTRVAKEHQTKAVGAIKWLAYVLPPTPLARSLAHRSFTGLRPCSTRATRRRATRTASASLCGRSVPARSHTRTSRLVRRPPRLTTLCSHSVLLLIALSLGVVAIQVARAENPLRPVVPQTCPEPWRRLMTECWAAPVVVRPSFTAIYQRLYDYAMSISMP